MVSCSLQLDFETELNIAPYMSNRRAGPQMYELYGVLVHAGHSVHSGHYYCFVRGPNGIWHHMDDTRVSQVWPCFIQAIKRALPDLSSLYRGVSCMIYLELTS